MRTAQILKTELHHVGRQAIATTWTLLRIMIPITIIVKILQSFGFIDIIGMGLSPLMHLVGLPGETGLVWATAMITNIYGGILVFISLASNHVFSVAEVTILGTMILIAHSLPVEVGIARKVGLRIWWVLMLRISCAFLLGIILHYFLRISGLFEETAFMAWEVQTSNTSFYGWAMGQMRNYLMIFLIIFSLLVLMRILEKSGIINKINQVIEPGLRLLGMSKDAAPITLIGMTLGISYGGGLIIQEARSGKLSEKDAFLSVSLMCLSHSLFEDTILMMTIGASLIGILLGRVIFTILMMILIVRGISFLSHRFFLKYFYQSHDS